MSLKVNKIQHQIIHENGPFPNNENLPLLHYQNVLSSLAGSPHAILDFFSQNGWINGWIDGIYPYHHYHSNTHEVLGISSGECLVQIGGENGPQIHLAKGDALIIPAGVSHRNLSQSDDFVCVGAYPFDLSYDMQYGKEDERSSAKERIKKVPLPASDPVFGKDGPLFSYWK